MSEAVIMPSLMMMTSIVSEESLAKDPHADTQTDLASSILNFFKFVSDFGKNNLMA